jgi:hypothetical protein
METKKPKFKSLNIYVKDYNEAIEFYEDMGFKIARSQIVGSVSYAEMILDNKSDFTIKIICGYPESHDGCISLTIHERMPSGFKGKSEYNLNDMSLMSFDCKDLEG